MTPFTDFPGIGYPQNSQIEPTEFTYYSINEMGNILETSMSIVPPSPNMDHCTTFELDLDVPQSGPDCRVGLNRIIGVKIQWEIVMLSHTSVGSCFVSQSPQGFDRIARKLPPK